MSNPGQRALPSGSAPPHPFTSALPGGSSAPISNADFRIRRVGMDADSTHIHKPTSHWTIWADVHVARWKKLKYHEFIRDGDYLIIMSPSLRIGNNHSMSSSPDSSRVLNIQSFNDLARRSWQNVTARLDPLLRVSNHTNGGLAKQYGNEGARLDKFKHYLKLPECRWGPLFEESSDLSSITDASGLFVWLCLEGITRSYRPLGMTGVEPNPRVIPGRQPLPGNQISVAVRSLAAYTPEGMYDVPNILGTRAYQGAFVFLVLKRHFDRTIGEYTHFALTVEARPSKSYSAEDASYIGVAGFREKGAVWLIGEVLEVHGRAAPEDVVPHIQGIEGNLEMSMATMRNYGKIRMLFISPMQVV